MASRTIVASFEARGGAEAAVATLAEQLGIERSVTQLTEPETGTIAASPFREGDGFFTATRKLLLPLEADQTTARCELHVTVDQNDFAATFDIIERAGAIGIIATTPDPDA